MMTNTWIAICDDVIGFYGIPTNTIKSFFEKRKELLRNVILSEIRQGDFSRVNEDDMIAICFRLLRDAMEGVAKNNLRLMARLICGLDKKQQLTATKFQYYSDALASLNEEEISFLASLYIELKNNSLEEKEIMIKQNKVGNIEVICGLLRTGFFVPFLPKKGTILQASEMNLYLPSTKLKSLFSFFDWEDIATYSCEGDKER